MRRRSGTKNGKTRRPGAAARPRTNRRRAPSGDASTIDQLRRELDEAREQQTATSEVLKVISSSPGELEPVFETLLANATHLCGAKFASLLLVEGGKLRRVAQHNAPSALVEHWRSMPLLRPHPKSAGARAAATKQVAF